MGGGLGARSCATDNVIFVKRVRVSSKITFQVMEYAATLHIFKRSYRPIRKKREIKCSPPRLLENSNAVNPLKYKMPQSLPFEKKTKSSPIYDLLASSQGTKTRIFHKI